MTHEILLGRQPIVDADGSLVAFELLFRSPPDTASGAEPPNLGGLDDLGASSHVIVRALADLGLIESLGRFSGYVNADRALLMSEVVELLPPQRFVLEVLERTEVDPGLHARLVELRSKGYRIALDDVIDLEDPRLVLLPLVDVVKVDLLPTRPEDWKHFVQRLGEHGGRLLAEKVETMEQFEQARAAGFTLFQGYFFARPQLLRTRRMPTSLPALVGLVARLEQDPDIEEVARAIRGHPALLKPMLREVNASSAARGRRVDSISTAIALVGLRQVSRWAQLLIYAEGRARAPGSDPLVQQVGMRARMMELLSRDLGGGLPGLGDRAFLTGMLSKVDVLLGMPIEDALRELPVTDEVRAALLGREGALGRLLALCEARERADGAALVELCSGFEGCDCALVAQAESAAAAWTTAHTGAAAAAAA